MPISMESPLLLVVGLAFAVVSGANDGSTLVALNLSGKAMTPLMSVALLSVAVAVTPFVVGTAVATTLVYRLVDFEGTGASATFALAVVAALVVVVAFGLRGIPSSLTAAMTGGIVGVGIGQGLPVSWNAVLVVLGLGVVAPLASGVIGYLVGGAFGWVPGRRSVGDQLRYLNAVGYVAQSVAYAANDSQKLIAIVAIAMGLRGEIVTVHAWSQLLLAVAFASGTLLGVARYERRLGRRVTSARSTHAIAAQIASAVAISGSAGAGVPVSMTQSATAALVGATASQAAGRVRWRAVVPIAGAWVTTLPASALIALPLALLARAL